MGGFAAFVRERRYLKNVSPSTVSWYTHALEWLPSESPMQEQLKDAVMRMRAKGLKETGCNANIRAINAYLHWSSGPERKCGAGCTHHRIQQLKEPQNILPTLAGRSGLVARKLETQIQELLPTPLVSAHAVVAGHRMPYQ
jgi:integrase/recombinase XerD